MSEPLTIARHQKDERLYVTDVSVGYVVFKTTDYELQ